ncbi:MAG: beta-lactamase family protein [Vicinamibacteria bacterium]|nr:beta-lactamase family protein [Vicinamibacteria bacterium]
MKREERIPFWLTAACVVVGVPITLAVGVWEYVSATATPIHPNPANVRAAAAAPLSAKWAEAAAKAEQVARAGIVQQNLPGLSVAVGIGSDVVWAEGFGYSNLEYGMDVKPTTRFRLGTASIALTSAGAGLLIEQGRLRLDEKIQTYVPEFPEKKWPVTLRALMAHTAGIRNDGGDEGPLFSVRCERPVDALPHFQDFDLRFEPETRYRYSSYGWILVSAAVEAAAKEPFLSFMKNKVFEPLGMNDTLADSGAEVPENGQANSYFPRYGADPKYGPDPMRQIDLSCYSGASIFVSTPTDLVRFGLAINAGRLLKPSTVDILQANHRVASGRETGYGLGWEVETVDFPGGRTKMVGHGGELLGGMAVSLTMLRETGIVVAVMSNTSYADTAALAVKIAEAFAAGGR